VQGPLHEKRRVTPEMQGLESKNALQRRKGQPDRLKPTIMVVAAAPKMEEPSPTLTIMVVAAAPKMEEPSPTLSRSRQLDACLSQSVSLIQSVSTRYEPGRILHA